MFTKLKQEKEQGFTIIEVLIVLAIAGVILLLVFLAVPALQRNSRNTQRKNDVQNLVGAIQEFTDNNNGKLPTAASDFTPNTKLGYYNGSGDVVYTVHSSANTTNPTDTSKVTIDTYSKCNNNQIGGTGAPSPSSRNVTAVYYIETSGGTQEQCQDM